MKNFLRNTRKQWGLDPSELDASVAARIPTRNNCDNRYFTDTFQSMPLHGYTRLFENMLSHPNIKVMLGTDYKDIKEVIPYKKMIFLSLGIKESQLIFFIEHTCVPDIMGLNYYITSERYLDEDLEAYPSHTHGGNGLHAYADIEAIRVKKPTGIKNLLQEAWNRFRLLLAITEAHLHCDEVEQMRWFKIYVCDRY